uniref:Uncharacterized protein n=1 Tax=Arundo donax TaxID=35708 RepID=A0A0A9CI29_ARUDO
MDHGDTVTTGTRLSSGWTTAAAGMDHGGTVTAGMRRILWRLQISDEQTTTLTKGINPVARPGRRPA